VLIFHLREELASRRGEFGRFYSAKEAQKLVGTEIDMHAA
jgi:hypothetical protein